MAQERRRVSVRPVKETPIEATGVATYAVPTDRPESDGTIEWDSTTIILVEVMACGVKGVGYTYADAAAARLIRDRLASVIHGCDAMAVTSAWMAMLREVRNVGRPGLASMAISAVDTALWDLKARLLGLPLVTLLDPVRNAVPVYGSGGFTSYSLPDLRAQLGGWIADGMRSVKMKVGREPNQDLERVRAAREAIGDEAELFVDANGAYSRKQALWFAEAFAELNVKWFEEPVSSDDLDGLKFLRDRVPAGMEIAAGEYGYDLPYFRRMLDAGAVDVLQADATRCAGISGLLRVGALCEAYGIDLSAHTAPTLHLAPATALLRLRHVEYFHDHARIEHLLFHGAPAPRDGMLHPDLSRIGCGVALRREEAELHRIADATH